MQIKAVVLALLGMSTSASKIGTQSLANTEVVADQGLSSNISKMYGGDGGASFADNPREPLKQLTIRHGKYVDKVCANNVCHGGKGGREDKIDTKNLCINRVTVWSGRYVDSLMFHGFDRTNNRAFQSKRFGGNGGQKFDVPLGGCLDGFVGRSWSWMDKIGFHSVKEITALVGSWTLVESYSGDINYYVEERNIKESSKAMTKEEASQYSISVSASYGAFGFGGSIESNYAQQNYLKQDFSEYEYSNTFTKQQRVCKAPGAGHSAQIWQWRVDGLANDGKTISFATKNYVCSSSKHKQPQCYPEQCGNGVCSKCK